ncbi:uncharacterized protein [Aegilops tauschii subsp. strangulata]|uniref:uncharacterized protein isoform X1 n=1 Tax=Aegilops tauschii subsp. strangulata TaxID=200361 RepID=UPI001E1CA4F5|nr:uncharacterized protein LOC109752524 isoform X2 [Aegilops tauschii subsp. strangulata]
MDLSSSLLPCCCDLICFLSLCLFLTHAKAMEPTAGTPWRRGPHGGDDAMDVRTPWRTQLQHHPDAISETPPDTSPAILMEGQGPHAQWSVQNAQASHRVSRHPLWTMTTTRASTATTTLRTWSNSATTSSTAGRRPWPCAASATTSSHVVVLKVSLHYKVCTGKVKKHLAKMEGEHQHL